MKILPIFDPQTDSSNKFLWTVFMPEDEDLDVFTKLLDQWNNTFYLQSFFIENKPDLIGNSFWKGISINNAIDKIRNEAFDFTEELLGIEQKPEFDKAKCINEIFLTLHSDEFIIRKNKDERFKKGKPDYN